MKCPYAVNRVVKTKTEFIYNAESVEVEQVTDEYNMAHFCDCLKTECGAYDTEKNRCNYANLR